MSEHDEKDQERTEEPEAAEVEDLDVPEEDSEDVKGGIMNAWPKKYDGG